MVARLIIKSFNTDGAGFEVKRGKFIEYRDNQGVAHMDPDDEMKRYIREVEERKMEDVEQNIEDNIAECVVTDIDGGDVSEAYFDRAADTREGVILKINVDPVYTGPDAEGELKYWFRESDKLLKDKQLSDDDKIKYLPRREYVLILGDKRYVLDRCIMLEYYKSVDTPYSFAMMVEEILKTA